MRDLDDIPTWTEVLAARLLVEIRDMRGMQTEDEYRRIATWPEDHPGQPLTPEE